MVKTILLLLSITTLVVSCEKKQVQNATLGDNPVANKTDSLLLDNAHNSQNSLDVIGIYKGIIPCADCEGIETQVELAKDNTYILTTKYLKNKDTKSFESKGKYSWNKEGNKITLDTDKLQFKVGEDKIIQLDQEGNTITGNLASKYFLIKEK